MLASRLRSALLVLLLATGLLNLVLGFLLIFRADEIRYGEAIIYEQAGRLLHGQPLYQPINQAPFTVTAYTPLYYWLVAGLRLVSGAGFGPGRGLSYAAGLVSVVLVAYLAWRRTRAVWPTLAAPALFLGLGLVGPIPWFASYKEDVLSLALSLGAIAALDGPLTRRRVVASAGLAALAILTKQTMFGAAMVGAWWLSWRDRRAAAAFVAMTVALVAAPLLYLELTTHALVANTVLANVNPFGSEPLLHNLALLLLFQTAPMLVVTPYLLRRLRLRTVARDVLLASWLVSLIPMLALAKEGADYNYWQLFAAITAIFAVEFVWDHRERASGVWSAAALALNAAVSLTIVGGVVAADPLLIEPGQTATAGFDALVATVHAQPHAVLADPLDTAVLADRSIVLEPVIYKLFYQVGEWDPAPILSEICDGDVSLLVLGYPLEAGAANAHAAQAWPAPVLSALRERLVLRQVVPLGSTKRYVYEPDPARPGCTLTGPSA